MKKLVLLLISFFVLSACGGDDKPVTGKLDPDTVLNFNLKPRLSPRAGEDGKMTPLEVLQKARFFQLIPVGSTTPGTRGIDETEKDYEKLAIKMMGSDIINHDTLATYWRDARDLIILSGGSRNDTIAYIPQRVRNSAFEKIFAAEREGNYELVYKLFQDAFEAIPCTPEEYKELKRQGLN